MRSFRFCHVCNTCVLLVTLACSSATAAAAPDYRPAFDKTPHLKTVWSAANPWWLPNKSRTHGHGGPDFAWHKYSDNEVTMWQQVAEHCAQYGLTGLQMELSVPNAGYVQVFRAMIQGFEAAGTGLMAQPFLNGSASDVAVATKRYVHLFDRLMPELKEHPNVYRLNGCPVVMVYSPHQLKAPEWQEVMNAVEQKHGRMIWLANANVGHGDPDRLRAYLPYWDGISMYANWSEPTQRLVYERVTDVMHKDFPQKIFEGAVHTTYCVHFHYGGVAPKLTEKYRNSWDITLGAEPDAVTITNWFDTYENSRIMPSYELEDSMLRIAQHRIAVWRGEEPAHTEHPDLYVTNYTSRLIGEPLHFEVISFPLSAPDRNVTIGLDVCDANENVLHAFPDVQIPLDIMRVQVFELGSEALAAQRAVFPRLRYTFAGREYPTYPFPPTRLVAGLRPHMLFWARSVKSQIHIDTSRDWQLSGASVGGTARWPGDGMGVITSLAFSGGQRGVPHRGGGWVRILRNGRELESFSCWDLKFTRLLRMPDPGAALDRYSLELENRHGCRYLSLPIWVSSEVRRGNVNLPILTPDDAIHEVEIEAVRVPFFMYECDSDTGSILYDSSGYDHHGRLGGTGYGGGHLGFTGYRHEHTGPVAPELTDACPRLKEDGEGRKYLEFNGDNYVMIQGGTAFPYASTTEFFVKPFQSGKEQGILGAPNGQIAVCLAQDGTIEVTRSGAVEGMGGAAPPSLKTVTLKSAAALPANEWSHVAVVYDLKNLSLFLNGTRQAAAEVKPLRAHEWINPVVLGGTCKFPYTPVTGFVGGLRRVRLYGRNLAPHEFLAE